MQRVNKFARLLGPTVVTMACALALRGQVASTPEIPASPAAMAPSSARPAAMNRANVPEIVQATPLPAPQPANTDAAIPAADARPADGPASALAQAAPTAQPAAPAGATSQPAAAGAAPAPTVKITTPSSKPTTSRFELKFQDANLDSILDYISEAAGFIVVRIGSLEGRVTVIAKQPVTPAESVTLLNAALTTYGYTAVQQDGRVLKVMPRSMAVSLTPVGYGSDPKDIPATDDMITQIIPVSTVDATKLRQDLAGMISLEATVTANQGSNTIIITDRSINVKRLVEIIYKLDVQGRTAATMKIYQLKNAEAADAAKLITDLFKQDTSSRSSSGSRDSGPPSPGDFFRSMMESRSSSGGDSRSSRDSRSSSRGEGVDRALHGNVTAVSDDRTNHLIVTGPPDTLKLIDQLVDKIDSDPQTVQTYFIYNLRNAQAINLEPVLNSMFGGGGSTSGSNRGTTGSTRTLLGGSSSGSSFGGSGSSGFGGSSSSSSGRSSSSSGFGSSSSSRSSSGRSSSGSRGTSTGGFGSSSGGSSGLSSRSSAAANDLMGQVYVVANPDTNSLLVTTATKFQSQVRQIIEELDRAVPQVLIKVLVAEVTHENTADYGIDFSVLNSRVRTNADGTTTTLGQTGAITNGNAAAIATGGLVVQVLEEHVNATLHALAVNGKLDVLSRPYILASDNQQAGITVGQSVPFITDNRITDTGQTISSVQYRDVGIILDVVPHINPEGLVNLEVSPEISQLTGTQVAIGNGVSAPVIATRSAYTYVSIRNGNTIVIGGLMEDRNTETVNKVPILGDIPFLGQAFKRTQKDKVKTELLIFLTPHVALQPETLKPMSKDELGGSKITTQAVAPGVFEDHMRGMKRGSTENLETGKPYERVKSVDVPVDTQPSGKSYEPTILDPEPTDPRDRGRYPEQGDRGNPRDQERPEPR